MKYLITTTLLNSFLYYMSEFGKREDFISLLAKDKFVPNEAILRGLQFEKDIEDYTKTGEASIGKIDPYLTEARQASLASGKSMTENDIAGLDRIVEIVKEFGDIVKGGIWQKGLSKTITIGNNQYVIYGKADVILRDTIHDVKYTGKYETGKFSKSMQHRIELACSPLDKFDYLISDLKSSWVETYHKTGKEMEEVKVCLNEFLAYLGRDPEAKELFEKNWLSKF